MHAAMPEAAHDSNQVKISINGNTKTLQEAMGSGQLKNKLSSSNATTTKGHTTDTIYLSINGEEKTLKQALETSYGLCATTSSSYTQQIIFGHTASEIEIEINSQTITFQEAINQGEFCTYSWHTNSWGTCSKSCGSGTQTRTVYCQTQDGTQVNDNKCTGTKPATSRTCNTGACTKYFSSVCVNNRGIEYCSQSAANAFCKYKGYAKATGWSKTGGGVGTPCSACEIWWQSSKWVNGNCDGYGFWYCKGITCSK